MNRGKRNRSKWNRSKWNRGRGNKSDPGKLPENFLSILSSRGMAGLKSVFQTCSLEATLSYGQTAVFYAQRMSEEMMRWLVEQGADINAVNKWGETSLHNIISHLAFEGQLQTVDLLIRLGADIHAVTPDGDTPLHYAAKWGHLSIVEKLVENNGDIYVLNKRGQTPMEYMMAKAGNSNIRQILPVAEYFIAQGVPVTDTMRQSVRQLAKGFAFHRSHYNKARLAEAEEALRCLLEIFDVPAPPPKRFYDGKAKILAAPGGWQEQFEELYLWILTPPLTEKAGTVQGELLRISGSVCSLILDGFVTDWAEFRTRVKLYSIPHFLHRGNPLLREEIREAKLVITPAHTETGRTAGDIRTHSMLSCWGIDKILRFPSDKFFL